jgi:hypothetical protein
MEKVYIIKTNYFNRRLTWIKRSLEFLVLLMFLGWIYYLEYQDGGTNYPWVKYALFTVVSIFIFVRQQDDLAVDKDNLYYMKKSLLPVFEKTTKYSISKIKSIGCGGVYDTDTEFLGRARARSNRLEIVFKDNSSSCHDVTIYKGELKAIVKRVQWLINQKNA